MIRLMNMRTSAFRMLPTVVLSLWAGALLPLSAQSDPNKVWDWKIPGELYTELNHIHRAQIDKAAKLFEEGHQPLRRHNGNNPKQRKDAAKFFKASALEWQKVRVQIGDSLDDSTLAYVIFMAADGSRYAQAESSFGASALPRVLRFQAFNSSVRELFNKLSLDAPHVGAR